MSDQYVGEIRMFAGNFAPSGWLFCEGQLLDISTYDVLFALIGTTYGGDGQIYFALPDLRGRLPVHFGNNGSNTYTLAEAYGSEQVTLVTANLPQHTHGLPVSSQPGTSLSPTNAYLAASAAQNVGFAGTADGPMAAAVISGGGSGLPHDNMAPYLCVSFIIATTGIYPTPT